MTTLFISHSSKDKAWAERVHKLLSDNGYQSVFLDYHPDDGIHAGAVWERTLYQRLRQSRGVVVLCSVNWLASPWCVAEAIMARERKRRVFLLATADVIDNRQIRRPGSTTPALPDFLKDRQFISLAGLTEEEAHQQLLRGIEKEGLKKHDFELPDRPYPGLKPFQETDAAVFFGREEETDNVINVVHRHRKGNANGFILVLGASGSGKSSLVRAGVLPQLKRASKDDAGRWVVVPPFIAGKGLEGLALSLGQSFEEVGRPQELSVVRGRLAGARDLIMLGSELLLAHSAPEGCVLVVLDQLEEAFGKSEEFEPRTALRLLLDASADASGSFAVLATMRSDFLNALQLFEGAATRYEEITLDPMLPSRFSEVIEGPADRFGIDLDAGLSERMVQDTAYNDALPLLAFILEKLYERCQPHGPFTLKAYNELGGVSAAIKQSANSIIEQTGYAGLLADDRRMRDLRRAFYRLVRMEQEGQFTRRTARWSQMPGSCADLLKCFVKHRLLVSAEEDGEEILYVAHEALFRVWDTLRNWLLQDRKALALRSQVEDAAAEWAAADRTDSMSWSETRIFEVVREIGVSGVSLDDVACPRIVRAFLGPTDQNEIARLPALTVVDDGTLGKGRYGDTWSLPLSHKARASAGARLALFGDTRGVGCSADGTPQIEWCVITSEVATGDEQCPEKHVRSLQIARYPITVAQYRGFLSAADGWRDRDWWGDDLHRDPNGNSYDFGRFSNFPAVYVSWYDAMAFCRWLSHRLGGIVRLPDDWEWQHVATNGDNKNGFPWGADWDPTQEPYRANTRESGLYAVTAVGMYPSGASLRGVLDLAGTVWEWCLNRVDQAEATTSRVSELRQRGLVRGGAWNLDQSKARSTSCDWYFLDDRYGNVGFRVVCSSLSSGVEH